jgi:hypothetical protein
MIALKVAWSGRVQEPAQNGVSSSGPTRPLTGSGPHLRAGVTQSAPAPATPPMGSRTCPTFYPQERPRLVDLANDLPIPAASSRTRAARVPAAARHPQPPAAVEGPPAGIRGQHRRAPARDSESRGRPTPKVPAGPRWSRTRAAPGDRVTRRPIHRSSRPALTRTAAPRSPALHHGLTPTAVPAHLGDAFSGATPVRSATPPAFTDEAHCGA